jgi:hypothetical protein
LGDDENIAEDDGGVELGESVDRLEGDVSSDGGCLAAFKEGVFFSDLEEFCRLAWDVRESENTIDVDREGVEVKTVSVQAKYPVLPC